MVWQRSYKNRKILHNLCLHFGRQNGQDGKKRKENHTTKVTKIRKYGMNKTLEGNQERYWKTLFFAQCAVTKSKYTFRNARVEFVTFDILVILRKHTKQFSFNFVQ